MADGGDFNVPGDPDYERRQQEAAAYEQQDIANAANPNWVPTEFGGFRGNPGRAETAYNERILEGPGPDPNQPRAMRNFRDVNQGGSYANYLNAVQRGYGGSAGQLPQGFRQSADLVLREAMGQTLKPQWAQQAEGFRRGVPLEQLKSAADALSKAKRQRRTMHQMQVLISLATMAAGGAVTGPLSGAAVGAAGGAAQGISQGAITGNWDPKAIGIGTAAGAAGGAVGASGMNPAAAGALSGGINSVARGLSTGKWDPADIAWGVGSGAAAGGARMAGVPSWVTSAAMPWANAGYGATRGRSFNPAGIASQSISSGVTSAMRPPRPTGQPSWTDPTNTRPINPQGYS